MSDDLVEWLRAQLDADQQKIAAILRRSPNWRVDSEPWDTGVGVRDDQGYAVAIAIGDYAAEHIASWDPSRVLREVDALRAIVDLHEPSSYETYDGKRRVQCGSCASLCHSRSGLACEDPIDAIYPCDTIRLLAAVYSDRPGYQERWRPA